MEAFALMIQLQSIEMAKSSKSDPPVSSPLLQRKCDRCPNKRRLMQHSSMKNSSAKSGSDSVPPIVHDVLRSPGTPLDSATRAFMEPRFCHDFSQVRVHTDAKAAESARAVNALAYTAGGDIVFGNMQYAPNRVEGKNLIAHELTHTIQQGISRSSERSNNSSLSIGPINDILEKTAKLQAMRISQGKPTRDRIPSQLSSRVLQRETQRQTTLQEPSWEETSLPKCGPDATDWFITTVNTAMRDSDVLSIKRNLSMANVIAASFGLTVHQLGETATTLAVLNEESRLGSRAPPRDPTISGQLAAGRRSVSVVGAAAPSALRSPTTITPFPSPNIGSALLMMYYLRTAAQGWTDVVKKGAKYDFKAHEMDHPRGATCPDDGCPPGEVGIITLCPFTNPQNCYESDVPGNLFYALIGRFIGWSELTLQLGSQYAELTDVVPRPARPTITWDTPDDTAAISLGYRLPLPLSKGALCGQVASARGSLAARHGCQDCLDPPISVAGPRRTRR